MAIRQLIQFGEAEIKSIIANHYNVGKDKVNIHVDLDIEGYGLNEHYVPVIKVEVETYNDEK